MSVIIKGGANTNLANVDGNGSIQVAMYSGSPLPAGTNILGALTAHQSTNVDQLNGTTVDTNSGNKSAGTLRVVIATDQPNLTSALNVSAAQSGVWTVRNVGNTGAIFDGPTAAAVPANAIQQGVRGATANPSAVTDGQLVAPMADKVGRLIIVHNAPRDLVASQNTAITNTSETTIVTAIASTFCDISGIQITNSSATATTVTIKDSTGGTTRKVYDIAANGGIVVKFDPPLPQASVNNNWTATCGTGVSTIHVNVDYVKNI
jgi:hypothetical protein